MKRIFLLSLIIFSTNQVISQVAVTTSESVNSKVRVGGGVGLNFGNNSYFGFNISPFIGYSISPKLEGGVSGGYQYSKSDFYKSNLFSFGPYLNYYAFESLFGRMHYEYYTGNQKSIKYNTDYNFNEDALWIGAGYQSNGRIRFQTGIMYNVLYDEDKSIFSSAIRPFGGVSVSL